MKKNIAKVNINYEVGVDIDELANDMAGYLEEALCEQFEIETCELILDSGMNEAALLNAVGRVWQEQFIQKVIKNKITPEKGA